MKKKTTITLKLYLESTRLDKQGAKHLTFEVSTNQSLEAAKLELMGRDLVEHLPVLLEGKFRIKNEDTKRDIRTTENPGF